MTGTPYAAGGIRTTVAATRAATDEQLTSHVARLVDEMRRQGTTTVEIKSGYGLTVRDEARSLAVARQFTEETTFLGAHVVPRAATPRRTSSSSPARCSTPPRSTPAGSTSSASGAPSTRTRPARSSPPVRPPGSAVGCTPTSSPTAPASGSPPSSGLVAVDHCTYLADEDVAALRDSGTIATLLPGRRVLDQAALPRRPSAARRRRTRRPRLRLQPRLLLHQLAPALHRARRPRDGDDPGRGASTPRRTSARRPSTATTSARSPSAGGPTWWSSTPRATCTSPTAPAYRSSPRPGWAAGRPSPARS